jgi:hypothetical protein
MGKLKSSLPGATEYQLAYLSDLCCSRAGTREVAEVKNMLRASMEFRGFIPRQMATQAISQLERVFPTTSPRRVTSRIADWLNECIRASDAIGCPDVQVPLQLAETIRDYYLKEGPKV